MDKLKNFHHSPWDKDVVDRLTLHSSDTPVPDDLRFRLLIVCREDLPDDAPYKLHVLLGYRVQDIQQGNTRDDYPLSWWAAIPVRTIGR